MDWGKLLDWINFPPKLLFALAAVCGALIFVPEGFLITLGLVGVVEAIRGWLGIGFVVFSVVLLSHLIWWAAGVVKPWIKEWLFIRLHRKRLHQLDDAEKRVLARFIDQNRRTLRLDVMDGTATVLVKERILAHAAHMGDLVDGIAYAVQPWAWEYLSAHRELLEPHLSSRSGGHG